MNFSILRFYGQMTMLATTCLLKFWSNRQSRKKLLTLLTKGKPLEDLKACWNTLLWFLWAIYVQAGFVYLIYLHNAYIFELIFLIKKKTSMLPHGEWYVTPTNQISAVGYVSRTNQSVVFVLCIERRGIWRLNHHLEREMLVFLCL